MNLILIGGAFLGAFVLNGAPLKTAAAPVLPAVQATKTAAATVEEREQPGFMTHDIKVDPRTGETTEISVIGFLD